MTAVGLTDVFKYGSKFLGYLLVVVVLGGGLLAAGASLTALGGGSLTDPSVSTLTDTRIAVGSLLTVAGVVVTLIGTFGLAHKFAADALATGLAQSGAFGASAAEAATADASAESDADEDVEGDAGVEAAEESLEDESDEPADEEAAPDQSAVDVPTAESAGTTRQTATDVPSGDQVRSVPSARPGPRAESSPSAPDSPGGRDRSVEAARATTDDDGPADAQPGDHPEPDDTGGTTSVPETQPAGSPAGEGDADASATEVAETGPGRIESGSAPADAGAADDHAGPVGEDDPVRDDEPAEPESREWTPPDPAEFEQPADDPGADAGDSPVDAGGSAANAGEPTPDADEEPDAWGAEPATGDDGSGSRTWDEVQADSSVGGTGGPSDPEDVGATAGGNEDVGFGDDAAAGASADPVDDLEEDRTLADEGVGSFEVESDDDPLSDALSEE